MDYDTTAMPAVYDQGRSHGTEVLSQWMQTVAAYVEGRLDLILDLGCGTGRFTEALAAYFGAQVIGVDPSSKMLEQAEAKRQEKLVTYLRASGEAIPLPDGSVDLVFISMVFHHFADTRAAARECRRVLRSGGTVFLRGGSCEHISSYPYVEFFPATVPILKKDLFSAIFMKEVFEEAGLRCVTTEVITQEIAPNLETYAEKLATRADSILVQLTDSDFAEGLAAVRSQAALENSHAVFEPIDVFVFRNTD
jgi:ubiquinone/menaquinone biosynthesis C-methylase UbiE